NTQIKLMKMVQMPVLEFQEYQQHELIENPYLEKKNEDLDNNLNDLDFPEPNHNQQNSEESLYLNNEDGEYDWDRNTVDYVPEFDNKNQILNIRDNNTNEDLLNQIDYLNLSDQQKDIIRFFVGNLEDTGYLKIPLETLETDIAIQFGIELNADELVEYIHILQSLQPPGIGARNLQECLVLQVMRFDKNDPLNQLTLEILKNHFEQFSKQKHLLIKQKLHINEIDYKKIIQKIAELKPYPFDQLPTKSSSFAQQTIIPDFYISEENNQLFVSLHPSNYDKLVIGDDVIQQWQVAKKNNKKKTFMYINNYIQSGKYLISLIDMRQNTLLKTMKAIALFQKDFFMSGDKDQLKPMLLKDIHAKTELDQSVISRVINNKYVQTQFGVYSLKFFFDKKAIHTNSSQSVTKTQLKQYIKELIEKEDKSNPLSDAQLSNLVETKGFPISRRVLAYYRKELGIGNANERLTKNLF
ncbi:MAG: RNA polymerase factor sigma-54, partial [Sediminibacterium sp.]|nr:RNA polymerase factor sigma-54 [Sediminibacterium sp.]